uniref:Uncharacterized protein n=1 Tax=Rhizophora mucronata TaxID=61149 RepID=A0A2P2PGI9_RHIMU
MVLKESMTDRMKRTRHVCCFGPL